MSEVLFSVVAPMKNEALNAPALADDIHAACSHLGPFEAIFVDDGSTDDTAAVIRRLRAEGRPWLRLVRHAASCGQSAATRSGILAARGPFIVTLDGDGQNPPSELPKLLAPLLAAPPGARLVTAGERVGRQDASSRKWASRLANGLRARMLKDDCKDSGCGMRAFSRAAYLSLPYFDHIHRYMPAMFKREGYRVEFIPVAHRGRAHGRSNYTNFGRALVGITDLLGARWLINRRKLPEVAREEAE